MNLEQKIRRANKANIPMAIGTAAHNKPHLRSPVHLLYSQPPMPAYTANIIQQAVQGPSLEELLAPVQADFAHSGMTQKQLLGLGRNLLDKVRAEKKTAEYSPYHDKYIRC